MQHLLEKLKFFVMHIYVHLEAQRLKTSLLAMILGFFPEQFVHRIKGKLQLESIVTLDLIAKYCVAILLIWGIMSV